MRSWIVATSSLAGTVMIAKVRTHSPVVRSFQFSHSPGMPKGDPSLMAMANGCLAFWPLIAFHSKKPSAGMRHRRSLTADLNTFTKFAAMPMRDYGNEAGADAVMNSVAGYPFGVDYSRGYPRSNPGEFTAVDVLARGEADAALIVGADPWTTMPQAALDRLDRIPHIVIDRKIVCRAPSIG